MTSVVLVVVAVAVAALAGVLLVYALAAGLS